VTIFDGVTDKLVNGDVLVKDNLIEQISSEPLSVIATTNTTTIDGGGRTLMPGLIESDNRPADCVFPVGQFDQNIGLAKESV